MPGMLNDQVVAVTGAGRGIGREIALLCAKEGASVVVNDFGSSIDGTGSDSSPATEVVREIESAGGHAITNFASVADPTGAESIIHDAVVKFGHVDALVNNAGILRDRIFHKMSHSDWNEVINVHLHGAFQTSKAAALLFKEQGHGAFVHFTSSSALIGNFGQANYSAAKMGIVGLSNSIAIDMQRFGVRSNCIAPLAWSRMIESISPQNEAERLRLERFRSMSAEKIAPLVAFLCSNSAKEVTGQVFGVRKNEIFLYNPMRPIRFMHRSEGWSAQSIASDLLPAFRPSMHALQRSADVFSWDPI